MITDETMNLVIDGFKAFVNELKEAIKKIWNTIKKAVTKLFEAFVIAMQSEDAKLTIRIYQRTKNKRIKKKKFKQLVGYLVDELAF